MTLYVEKTPAPYIRVGNMIPEESLSSDEGGFRSVYSFCETDALVIKNRGSSKGFAEFAPSAVCLFIDIDIHSEQEDIDARAQIDALKASGLRFELWDSGNRSYHLHIPHPLKRGYALPHTHKEVVKSLGITCDNSLYRNNSLFRLPGTTHAKTGKKKVLLGVYGDIQLDFDLLPEERFTTVTTYRAHAKGEVDSIAVASIFKRILEYVGDSFGEEENRYLAVVRLIYPLAPFVSFSTAMEIALLINSGIRNPNNVEEVVRAVRGCYNTAST